MNPIEPPFIYALIDPLEPEHIRYVGMTMVRYKRPWEHDKEARRKNFKHTHLIHWVRKLQEEGRKYDVLLLQKFSTGAATEDVQAAERHHIKALGDAGHILTNSTAGGEGVLNPTPEVRAKIQAGWTPERRVAQSERMESSHALGLMPPIWNKGVKGVQKAWNKGLTDHLSEEQHKRSSDAAKQRPPTSEATREKRRLFATGRKHTAESRAKIVASNHRRWAAEALLSPSEKLQRKIAQAEAKIAKLKAGLNA